MTVIQGRSIRLLVANEVRATPAALLLSCEGMREAILLKPLLCMEAAILRISLANGPRPSWRTSPSTPYSEDCGTFAISPHSKQGFGR